MFRFFKTRQLRNKLLFTVLIIIIFRVLAFIPVPGVNASTLSAYIAGNPLLGIMNAFSGGGFQNFSIITLGLGPYINASIIIQLFITMIPSLEELSKEGEQGREKINQYTRLLTLPIAILQAYGIYFLLQKQLVISHLSMFNVAVLVATLTAGVLMLVWLGELVTERGIGNGISLLIFVGIISQLPSGVASLYATAQNLDIITMAIIGLLSLAVIFGVVLVNEGTRNITLEYGRRDVRSAKVTNYLPIKINQAGVIPIIFAVSLVLVPSLISGPLLSATNYRVSELGRFLALNFSPQAFGYNFFYFALVVGFTFFYTTIQFNPEKVADDLKKRGGFIPGVRPGKATKDYLNKVVLRLTLWGALFLGTIAVLPYIIQTAFGIDNLTLGGTSILIVVSVVLETIRQIESQSTTKSYEGYLN